MVRGTLFPPDVGTGRHLLFHTIFSFFYFIFPFRFVGPSLVRVDEFWRSDILYYHKHYTPAEASPLRGFNALMDQTCVFAERPNWKRLRKDV